MATVSCFLCKTEFETDHPHPLIGNWCDRCGRANGGVWDLASRERRRQAKALGIATADVDPLDDLAFLRAMQWRVLSDIGVRAREAVEAGASWAEVGRALGITRQAAQQRFGRR